MSHFQRAMTLNLERLGIQLGDEKVSSTFPVALEDAQKDFLALSRRLRPLGQRVDDLSNIASNVASLQAAFKGIRDSEQGLRLNIFAAAIFPLTLVAAMFSMGEDYLPGKDKFWIFWATSVPLAFVVGVLLTLGWSVRALRRWWTRREDRKQKLQQDAAENARRSAKVEGEV